MIKFACSKCSKTIRVDEKYAGKKGKCPKCGTAVVVPERSTIIEFHCDGCGAKIKVPDRHAGKKGKCPKCQGPIVVPELAAAPAAPEAAPEPEAPPVEPELPPEPEAPDVRAEPEMPPAPDAFDEPLDEEEPYEEPAPEPRPAAGLDRRLLIAIGGGAVVVVVVIVGAILFLRSGGSEPVAPPRPPRRTAQTDPRPEPAPAEQPRVEEPTAESPTTPATPVAADAVTLKFAPVPGEKQSRRVTTVADMVMREGEQEFQATYTQSFAVDLEAREAQADGTIPIRVTLAQLRIKTQIGAIALPEFDSADSQSVEHPEAGTYVPFVGKRFTIRVSGQGELVDSGLDELFLAVAVDRLEAEDDMIGRFSERTDKVDQRHGSRQERTRVLKKQLQEDSMFGGSLILDLIHHLVASLPTEPVLSGATWNGPLGVHVGTRVEVPGAYTLADIGQDSYTIDAQGQRGAEEEPFVYQAGDTTVSNRLSGTVQMQMVLDRKTGWLLRKEQKTSMAGKVMRVPNQPGGQPSTTEGGMEMTTTVGPVE